MKAGGKKRENNDQVPSDETGAFGVSAESISRVLNVCDIIAAYDTNLSFAFHMCRLDLEIANMSEGM